MTARSRGGADAGDMRWKHGRRGITLTSAEFEIAVDAHACFRSGSSTTSPTADPALSEPDLQTYEYPILRLSAYLHHAWRVGEPRLHRRTGTAAIASADRRRRGSHRALTFRDHHLAGRRLSFEQFGLWQQDQHRDPRNTAVDSDRQSKLHGRHPGAVRRRRPAVHERNNGRTESPR